ncbi:glycoside hydrolase family 76 protein [Luteolibacter marinus]|uniref:glycoside hydrolase family 76 protein n=1 Tax=Luteolibacter marinus TaxID=2776705 RepID=UPI001867E1FC|nr:glycoside hydrolase family 76 protein [Luteolibacter marinus]
MLRAILAVTLLVPPGFAEEVKPVPPFRTWGNEAIRVLHKDLWMPKEKLYAEKAVVATGKQDHPSFMWGVGVQLSALAAAAELEPDRFLKPMKSYADEIQAYWNDHNGIEGFDVQPGPRASDRYYDDNAWLVLALAEVHELTRDKKYLERAEATFRFVMSGEDEKLDGGLYWQENDRRSKNTCTNAPAIVSALRLHQLTGKKSHLETARRLHAWVCKNLQNDEGLFWDNIKLDGSIDRRTFSYNSALMIRANCLFHEITGDDSHLKEARRIALASEKRWIRGNGAIADSGRFGHLLLESFVELYRRDKDPHWKDLVSRCLVHLHDHIRDENGRYPNHWERRRPGALKDVTLLDQASPARIYWLAAREFGAD